jgi:hypothetical protein
MVEKRIVGINKKPVAYCTSCSEYFKGGTGLSELKRHKATSKHEKRAHLATLIEEQRKKNAEACSNSSDNSVVIQATRMCISCGKQFVTKFNRQIHSSSTMLFSQ